MFIWLGSFYCIYTQIEGEGAAGKGMGWKRMCVEILVAVCGNTGGCVGACLQPTRSLRLSYLAAYSGKYKSSSEMSIFYGRTKCLQRRTNMLGSGWNQGICKEDSD